MTTEIPISEKDDSSRNAMSEEPRRFVERVERREEEKKDISGQVREVLLKASLAAIDANNKLLCDREINGLVGGAVFYGKQIIQEYK